jgi:arginyl-tRNA synthetase
MIEEKIKESIEKALVDIGQTEVTLERPKDISHGDYSSNVALVLSRSLKINPSELAQKIVNYIENDMPEFVSKVEAVVPGFINFYLSDDYFIQNLNEVISQGDEYGSSQEYSGQKIMFEYTDPNPFKEFHIGHLMTNTVGESLARIFDFSGAEVRRANYQGDIGIHVTCSVWGMLKNKEKLPDISTSLIERTRFMGLCYAEGATKFKEDEKIKEEIRSLNKKIFERSDDEVNEMYDLGRGWSLEYFETIYTKLGMKNVKENRHFDFYFFESQIASFAKQKVEEFLEKGVFEKSDGAIIFPGEKYGLHTRVFINSQGLPTYEGKELGLAKIKYDNYSYDYSFIFAANEIKEYFDVLIKAMSLVFPKLAEKTEHISHGMLVLNTGKMSSRTGKIISAEFLMDEVAKLVKEKIEIGGREVGDIKKLSDMIALASLKYTILKQDIYKNIVFDPEKSASLEGDTGPYLQYTYVRAYSIVKKSENNSYILNFNQISQTFLETNRLLSRFTEKILLAAKERRPHHICSYLHDLAKSFNNAYGQEKVLEGGDVEYKLAVTKAVAIVLKNGLNLLGIEAPNRM